MAKKPNNAAEPQHSVCVLNVRIIFQQICHPKSFRILEEVHRSLSIPDLD